jgi:Zn-dependent protease with chaperone function
MKRLARSEAYARARLVTATLFALFGSVIIVRTWMSVGPVAAALPAYILGLALIALAVVRLREYRASRRQP